MKWFYAIVFSLFAVSLLRDIVFLITDIYPVNKFSIIIIFAFALFMVIDMLIKAVRDLRSEHR